MDITWSGMIPKLVQIQVQQQLGDQHQQHPHHLYLQLEVIMHTMAQVMICWHIVFTQLKDFLK